MKRYRKRSYKISRTKRGGFLPLLLAGIPALVSAIAGGIDIAQRVKAMQGKGVKTLKYKRAKKPRGRGLANLSINSLPHLMGGALVGMNRPMHMLQYTRPLVAHKSRGGLLAPAGGAVRAHKVKGHMRRIRKGGAIRRIRVKGHKRGGYVPYTF